ncbi:MAG: hypothetical protein BWZ10_00594 [candidate division BRC1 bacterium ADurb.BinA364]|nr:MAG: hypothetical protein BWZ10_00594 [candidate division BRC1 bacterium ADurb.BinA364]
MACDAAHCFRHAYATLISERIGHNPFQLQSALGRRRIETTARDTHAQAHGEALPVGRCTKGNERAGKSMAYDAIHKAATSAKSGQMRSHSPEAPLSTMLPPATPIQEKPARRIEQTPAPLSSMPTTR